MGAKERGFMATNARRKMGHAAAVSYALDDPGVCKGWPELHGPIARRADVDVKAMARSCKRLMDDVGAEFEQALMDPVVNSTAAQVRKRVCARPRKRRKAYCERLWSVEEEPVPRGRTKREAGENGRRAEAFFQENKKAEGVTVLAAGLQEKIIRRGNGTVHPTLETSCQVHYRGVLLDCKVQPGPKPCEGGTEFDSTYSETGYSGGLPANFNARIAGSFWEQALPRMVEGDQREYYVPHMLAYGGTDEPDKRPKVVGPNASLIFIVELLAVRPATGESKATSGVASSAAVGRPAGEIAEL